MNYYWKFWSLRQLSSTAAQMGILQDIPIGDNLDRTLLWPDIAGPSLSNWKKVLFRGDIQTMEINLKENQQNQIQNLVKLASEHLEDNGIIISL